jgi:hypothetical protein
VDHICKKLLAAVAGFEWVALKNPFQLMDNGMFGVLIELL